MNLLYGTEEYWTNLSRMANWAQLWMLMIEIEDMSNSELGAKIGEQNDKYLKLIINNQEEIMSRLDRMEAKLNAE